MINRNNILVFVLFILVMFLEISNAQSYMVQANDNTSSIEGNIDSKEGDFSKNNKDINSGNIKIVGVISLYFLLSRLGEVNLKFQVFRKNKKSLKLIKSLKGSDDLYSNEHIINRVEKVYYKFENAWASGDISLAENYMSHKIFNLQNTKFEWMKLRNERYIIKDPKFLVCKVIGLEQYKDKTKNVVWVYLKYSLSTCIIKGHNISSNINCRKKTYNELWKMSICNGEWVLDEIVKGKDKLLRCSDIVVKIED